MHRLWMPRSWANNFSLSSSNSLNCKALDNNSIVTVADSGTSGHYLTLRHTAKFPAWAVKFPITVKLPDGTRI